MFGRKKKGLSIGDYIFATQKDGEYNNMIFGAITGVEGSNIGVNGILVNPVGLKNKVSQGKAGEYSVEILKNPTPDNCIMALIYRIEHENYTGILDVDKQHVLIIPPKLHDILDGWIRESLPEIINNVLSLPPGAERDEAKRILRNRRDSLHDKHLKKNVYSICRSLKILF